VGAYAVEESIPAGLTEPSINGGGSWDAVNRKVKWGPFFDANSRTLTYTVDGPDDTYTVIGTASFDGVPQTITGEDQVTIYPFFFMPADSDEDWSMEINDVTGYGGAWKRGEHDYINYVTRSGFLWKNGEVYHDTGSGAPIPDSDSTRWVPGAAPAPGAAPVFAQRSGVVGQSTVVAAIASGGHVSLIVTPDSGVSAYAVEESIPAGLTPSEITDGGAWDVVNRKVKWGPFFDTTPKTLTYVLTGVAGDYSLSGTGGFDGSSVVTMGVRDLTVGSVSFDGFVGELPADQRGESDEPDKDGWVNLVEFLFDTDPSDVSAAPPTLPTSSVMTGASLNASYDLALDPLKRYRLVEVEIPTNLKGLTVVLEASRDLSFSDDAMATEVGMPTNQGATQTRRYLITPSVDESSAMFWRMNVTR